MPISDSKDYPTNHFTKIYENIFIPAIKDSGYEPYRVDENLICDSIINKIFDAIQNSEMCLCDLSSRNPNVLYELGIRQAYDKPVVLVQDKKTEKIFDVGGISTVYYRSERLYDEVIEDREKIKDAIIATRDGATGYNSIIKVIKANKAVIDTGKISDQERIEIMLSAIQNDVKSLKNANSKFDGDISDGDLSTSFQKSLFNYCTNEDYEFDHDKFQNLMSKAITKKDPKLMLMLMESMETFSKKAKIEGNAELERVLCNYRDTLRRQIG